MATVMVGEDESVGRNDHSRAVAREVYYGVHDGIIALVELVVGGGEAITLHLLIDSLRQIVECPHTFIGMGGSARQ